jgi:hypothetical protein
MQAARFSESMVHFCRAALRHTIGIIVKVLCILCVIVISKVMNCVSIIISIFMIIHVFKLIKYMPKA